MYVGRILAIGKTKAGFNSLMYRVSSRSFPSRKMVELDGGLTVLPKEGFEKDLSRNPYISYTALRVTKGWAIATNGSQTEPITEKVAQGVPVRDAMVHTLIALDYEKDDFSTPRIAAAVPLIGDTGWLGIVRNNGLEVKEIQLELGKAHFLATYEIASIDPSRTSEFDANSATNAAQFVIDRASFGDLEKPVTSGAALAGSESFTLGHFTVSAETSQT